jgi:hypothetical protein
MSHVPKTRAHLELEKLVPVLNKAFDKFDEDFEKRHAHFRLVTFFPSGTDQLVADLGYYSGKDYSDYVLHDLTLTLTSDGRVRITMSRKVEWQPEPIVLASLEFPGVKYINDENALVLADECFQAVA